jgi:hypothetical protein
MARRWWKWLLLIVCLTLLVLWGYDYLFTVYWVNFVDLEVEFAVTDANSGHPIPGARIDVFPEGGFTQEREKQRFELTTDANGLAHTQCNHCMCGGSESGLRFTDTFGLSLPGWRYQVQAPGFEPFGLTDLSLQGTS